MRVAVLADIHGNVPALEAVLGEVDAAGADAIVLPGDMTVGPLQAETLDLLVSLGERAIWVRGNCERNLVEVYDGTYQPTGAAHEPGVIWSGQQLTGEQRDHLATLPLTVSVDVDGLGPVLFCHATARDDEEIVLVDSPLEWFAEGFAGVAEQTIVCGHTHMPFDRLANGCRIVNPGSVGMPYGPPGTVAYWAVLGPGVTLRRTAYDLEGAAERMRASAWPGNTEFIQENVLGGPPSDTEAWRSSAPGPGSAAGADQVGTWRRRHQHAPAAATTDARPPGNREDHAAAGQARLVVSLCAAGKGGRGGGRGRGGRPVVGDGGPSDADGGARGGHLTDRRPHHGGLRTTPALAEATGADADALDRVLRHLVTAGVLGRDQSDRYVLTAQGQALRADHPAGMRAVLDLEGAIGRADLCFVQLLHTVRTGEPAFPAQFGRSFWDDLAADPTRSASFDAQMGADVAAWAPDIVAAYDWGSLGHLVDVGGGNGALLATLLREYPGLRGTVLDLPGAAEAARKALTAAGLADRSDATAGSFFDPLPPGAGGYLLCAVLHDWDDGSARAILRRCAQAAGTHGRVLVVEKFVTDSDHRTEMDLRVLAYFGGRERDLAELTALAAAAGLRVAAVHPAGATPVVELTAR